jgi:hypothetical protein
MIEFLRRLNSQLDRPVLVADIDELFRLGEAPSHRVIEREFGGMAKARKAAGINNSYKNTSGATRYWQKYTPEELIEQLKKLGEKLGSKPTIEISTGRVRKDFALRLRPLLECLKVCLMHTEKPDLRR